MSFIHSREYLEAGDVVVVECSHQCNVMLTTDSNFSNYKHSGHFQYHGGNFKRFPARIEAPRTGYWNITIDLGSGRANIKYSINIIRRS